jgi:DNA-binding NarL/FixJ family response regulator
LEPASGSTVETRRCEDAVEAGSKIRFRKSKMPRRQEEAGHARDRLLALVWRAGGAARNACERAKLKSAKPMRTWLVATEKLKKPIRTAIVEDETALRKMIVSLLQADPNYTVVAEFAEGKAAIAAISHMALDIVLVDIGLPDISGIDVIRKLKALCPECNVLVITTFGDEKTVTSALEAGADGYLLKGIALEELKRDIHALQDGGSPLSPMIARKLLNRLQSKAVDEKPDSGGETKLTRREHEILEMIAKGFSYAETSKICSISAATVHSHLKSIYRKLEVHSKTEAVYEARRRSLIH